jgi:AcrR family transcriptional regulator
MAMRQKSSVSAVTSKDGPDGKWSLAALPNQTAEKVIGASEELFAKFGYNACTFKMISAKSKVNQGLIYYYFGSKENLFSEIFMRWAEPLAQRRNMMLDELKGASPGGRLELEDIIRAFIMPVLEIYERGQNGRAFLRIHAHLRTEPVAFALALRRKAFSASTERFLKLVQATCPHLSRATVGWRFNAMIGAYQMAISRGGRVEDFFSTTKAKIDMREALEQTIKFSVAGFLAEE